MLAYEPYLPGELRQAAVLLEQGELRQALEKAASVVGALERKLQASTAEPEPTGEAGAQAFATLLEFLQAMLGSDSEDVVAAAREQVQRWEGGEGEEEGPAYPIDEDGHAIVPDGVIALEDDAFLNCSSLISVTLPDSLTSIGEGAFEGCSALAAVTLPDSLMTLERLVPFQSDTSRVTKP